MEKFRVIFYPDKKSAEVVKDTTILSAAISAGVYLNSVCGGDGVCGRCKVRVKSGKVLTQGSGSISPEEKRRQIYLACLTTVHGDVEIDILPESQMELETGLKGLYSAAEEISPFASGAREDIFAHSPLAAKIYIELPKPTLEDSISDLDRLCRSIKYKQGIMNVQTGLVSIRQLGELLRDADWKVTVTLGKRDDSVEIVLVEPGDTSHLNYGLVFDIGTTTISGQLVDLNDKKVLGTKATYNRQASFGSDVITRIIYAEKEDGLQKLHNAVVETINEMIRELTQEHKVDLNNATCIICTGNTTMVHLLLSIDPSYIRREPYVPTANFLPVVRASEAGIKINPRGLLYCVPGVSSYVGGDTTSGVLSSGLYKQDEIRMLIDIGTNGEIAMGNREFLVGCAASAGPAFEGSGVTCGMRASNGAIQKVSIEPATLEVAYNTIGDSRPRGICGSGYIDLLCEMLSVGIIDKSGHIIARDPKRIRDGKDGWEFIVVPKENADSSSDIVITEPDIENLKRSKAAIYSATAILVRHMDLDFSDVKNIFIAGGFGTYIDMEKAIKIGLLPDLDREKFVFIGNSALSGARQMILSAEAIAAGEEIARKITYFELSVDPHYMDEYMAALFFPHTDLGKFPSVKF